MQVRIKGDSVEITGYVNAIERDSRPLMSRVGRFIERICKGAFKRALERNDDVHILLNHDWARDLGSTKTGNLELHEDAIGLHARATICDADVIKKARAGDLVGWSFGFQDRDVERSERDGIPYRAVRDLDLFEVSILDRAKTPAYEGTLIAARDDSGEGIYSGENMTGDVETVEERAEEPAPETAAEPEQAIEKIDYTKYENLIAEMKGDQAHV